jgi:hypothetical protein
MLGRAWNAFVNLKHDINLRRVSARDEEDKHKAQKMMN